MGKFFVHFVSLTMSSWNQQNRNPNHFAFNSQSHIPINQMNQYPMNRNTNNNNNGNRNGNVFRSNSITNSNNNQSIGQLSQTQLTKLNNVGLPPLPKELQLSQSIGSNPMPIQPNPSMNIFQSTSIPNMNTMNQGNNNNNFNQSFLKTMPIGN